METSTQTALVLAAQAGDQTAFDTLVEPYRRELLVHFPAYWITTVSSMPGGTVSA